MCVVLQYRHYASALVYRQNGTTFVKMDVPEIDFQAQVLREVRKNRNEVTFDLLQVKDFAWISNDQFLVTYDIDFTIDDQQRDIKKTVRMKIGSRDVNIEKEE